MQYSFSSPLTFKHTNFLLSHIIIIAILANMHYRNKYFVVYVNWNFSSELLTSSRVILWPKMDLTLIASFVTILIFLIYLMQKIVDMYFPKDLDQFFKSIDRLSSRKIFSIKLFHKNQYFINDPELIHKVLNSEVCLEKPRIVYKFLGLNDGLLCCKCEY